MRLLRARRTPLLIGLGLLLTVLANLGLTVHVGHQSFGLQHHGSSLRLLGEHSEPDSSLHLERLVDVRQVNCPACQLQQQLGGSHLSEVSNLDRSSICERQAPQPRFARLFQPSATRFNRGPPSC